MRKLLLLCAALLVLCNIAQAQSCALPWLAARLSAVESTGYNRGPLVDKIIVAGGGNPYVRKSPEWCGFTQAAANRACGCPIPRNGTQGRAAAWFPLTGPDAHRTVFFRGRRGSIDSIRAGQKAGFDYGAGIHHVNAVAELGRPVRAGRAPRSVWCVGGNEGTGATAGVKRNLWPVTSIDGLSDWSK